MVETVSAKLSAHPTARRIGPFAVPVISSVKPLGARQCAISASRLFLNKQARQNLLVPHRTARAAFSCALKTKAAMPNKIHDEIRAEIARRLNDSAKTFAAQGNPAAATKLLALANNTAEVPDAFIQKWRPVYDSNLPRWLAVVSATITAAGSANLDYIGFLTSLDAALATSP
jgi:hypothetical protein